MLTNDFHSTQTDLLPQQTTLRSQPTTLPTQQTTRRSQAPSISTQIPAVAVVSQSLRDDALRVLAETSRTFYIPVIRLPAGLLEAVGSAYLCLRAIDEVEDHPDLEAPVKAAILRHISRALLEAADGQKWERLSQGLAGYGDALPEVTLRLEEWLRLPPDSIAARVWDATAAMADRMARWVDAGFEVRGEADLDTYTFVVAGAVGLLLSDLWAW